MVYFGIGITLPKKEYLIVTYIVVAFERNLHYPIYPCLYVVRIYLPKDYVVKDSIGDGGDENGRVEKGARKSIGGGEKGGRLYVCYLHSRDKGRR